MPPFVGTFVTPAFFDSAATVYMIGYLLPRVSLVSLVEPYAYHHLPFGGYLPVLPSGYYHRRFFPAGLPVLSPAKLLRAAFAFALD